MLCGCLVRWCVDSQAVARSQRRSLLSCCSRVCVVCNPAVARCSWTGRPLFARARILSCDNQPVCQAKKLSGIIIIIIIIGKLSPVIAQMEALTEQLNFDDVPSVIKNPFLASLGDFRRMIDAANTCIGHDGKSPPPVIDIKEHPHIANILYVNGLLQVCGKSLFELALQKRAATALRVLGFIVNVWWS